MKKFLRFALMICAMMTANAALADDLCDYTFELYNMSFPYNGQHGWQGSQLTILNEGGQTLYTLALDGIDYDAVTVSLPHETITCNWQYASADYFIYFNVYDYNGFFIGEFHPTNFQNPYGFLTLNPACSPYAPGGIEGFTATGFENSHNSRLTWTNPSLNVSGEPTEISSIVIERDGEVIENLTDAQPGAAMSYVDVAPHAGEWTYNIYAVNEYGIGVMSTDIDTVGVYCNIPRTGTTTITTSAACIYSLVDENGMYLHPYDGMLVINPTHEGEYVHLEGIHFMYDGWGGDGTKDHVYVYDGVGTEGTLLADGFDSCYDGDSLNVTSTTGSLTVHFSTLDIGQCKGVKAYASCITHASVSENDIENAGFYPNPADNQIVIDLEDMVSVKVLNAAGQTVMVNTNKTINVTSLKSGFYILNIETEDGNVITRKVVIRH